MFIESEVSHLVAPFNTRKRVVSQARREKWKVGFGSKYFEQIVPDASEWVVIVILFEAGGLSHELDGGQTTGSQEPVPHIEAQEHYHKS